MILGKHSLTDNISNGNIVITSSLNPKVLHPGPNSIDVRLSPILYRVASEELDLKQSYEIEEIEIPPDGYVLEPGQLYLGATMEYCETSIFVPTLEGRSTMARYGIEVHLTAGFGDVGFKGHWTLEIRATRPIRIYPYVRIAQLAFMQCIRDSDETGSLYRGTYNDGPHEVPTPRVGVPNNF